MLICCDSGCRGYPESYPDGAAPYTNVRRGRFQLSIRLEGRKARGSSTYLNSSSQLPDLTLTAICWRSPGAALKTSGVVFVCQ